MALSDEQRAKLLQKRFNDYTQNTDIPAYTAPQVQQPESSGEENVLNRIGNALDVAANSYNRGGVIGMASDAATDIYENGDDYMHAFVNGFGITPLRGLAGVGRAIGENLGSDTIADASKSALNSDFLTPYEIRNPGLATDVMQGLGSVGTTIGLAALTKNPALVGAGISAITTGGNDYEDLRNKGVDPGKAAGYSAADAGITGALEKVNVGHILKGKGALKGFGRGFISEGTTEGLQEIPNEVFPALAADEEIDPKTVGQNAVYNGIIGGLTGGAMGGLHGALSRDAGQQAGTQTETQNTEQAETQNTEPTIAPVDLKSAVSRLKDLSGSIDTSTQAGIAQMSRIEDTLATGSDADKIALASQFGWSAPSQSVAMKAMDYLINQKGYTPEQAAGIVGNGMREAGGDTFDIDTTSTNSDGSYGFAQWLDDRRTALEEFARERGADPSDLYTQLDFLDYEMRNGYADTLNGLNGVQNPEDAAIIFHDGFEKSADGEENLNKRRANARAIYDAWSGMGGTRPAPQRQSTPTIETLKAEGTKIPESPEEQAQQAQQEQAETNAAQEEEDSASYSPEGEIAEGQFDYVDDAGRPRSPSIDRYWKKINETPTEELMKNSELVRKVRDAINDVPGAREWLHTTQMSGETLRRLGAAISRQNRLARQEAQRRIGAHNRAVEERTASTANQAPVAEVGDNGPTVQLAANRPSLNIRRPVGSGRARTRVNNPNIYQRAGAGNAAGAPGVTGGQGVLNPQTLADRINYGGQVDFSTPEERQNRVNPYAPQVGNNLPTYQSPEQITYPGQFSSRQDDRNAASYPSRVVPNARQVPMGNTAGRIPVTGGRGAVQAGDGTRQAASRNAEANRYAPINERTVKRIGETASPATLLPQKGTPARQEPSPAVAEKEGTSSQLKKMAKKAADTPAVVNAIKKADEGDPKAKETVSMLKPGLADAVREELKNREEPNAKADQDAESKGHAAEKVEKPARPASEGQKSAERKEAKVTEKKEDKKPAKEEAKKDDHIIVASVPPLPKREETVTKEDINAQNEKDREGRTAALEKEDAGKSYKSKTSHDSDGHKYRATLKAGKIIVKDGSRGRVRSPFESDHDVLSSIKTSITIPVSDVNKAVTRGGNPIMAINRLVEPVLRKRIGEEIRKRNIPGESTFFMEQVSDSPYYHRLVEANGAALRDVYEQYLADNPRLANHLHYELPGRSRHDIFTENIFNKNAVDNASPVARGIIDKMTTGDAVKPANITKADEAGGTIETNAAPVAESEVTEDAGKLERPSRPVEVRAAGEGSGDGTTGREHGRSGEEPDAARGTSPAGPSENDAEAAGRGVQRPGAGRDGNEAGRTDRVGNDERGTEKPVKESITPQIDKIEDDVEKHRNMENRNKDFTPKALPKRSPAQRLDDNIAAIKLLKKIESEGRKATPKEQTELAKYSGWGGLSSAFNSAKWKELSEILTKEELNRARNSTTDAFYTPPYVVASMWKLADRLGFKGGRVLDPSTGTGIFFGLMPAKIRALSSMSGTELDPLTAHIASQLYQNATIQNMNFADLTAADGYFDIAISNVPFGSSRPNDTRYNKFKYKLHNYFFAKSLDKVRPGGLVMFVTSRDTMDGRGDAATLRRELGKKAQFVGAIRLPGTVFSENNTDVTTDIVVLRKLNTGEKAPNNEWNNVEDVKADYYEEKPDHMNSYFVQHPDMIIGYQKSKYNWASRERTLWWDTKDNDKPTLDVEKELDKRLAKFPKDIYEKRKAAPANTIKAVEQVTAKPGTHAGDVVDTDGVIGQVVIDDSGKKVVKPYAKSAQKKMRSYLNLQNALDDLSREQNNPQTTEQILSQKRKALNKAYDAFVKDYGYLHSNKNRALVNVNGSGRVLALEKYSTEARTGKETAEKADIFTKRTVGTDNRIVITVPSDALAASLQEEGRPDIPYMAKLLGKPEKEVIKELGDSIIKDPVSGNYVTRDEYLSGNVREKLKAAEDAARRNPDYQKNVDALKKIMPRDLTPDDISVEMGASWISPQYIHDFAVEKLGCASDDITVEYDPIGSTWRVSVSKWAAYADRVNREYGTDQRKFSDILSAALNLKKINISPKKSGNEEPTAKEINDANVASAAANNNVKKMKSDFAKWLWSDAARKKTLLETYNNTFNSEVAREYDGSFLTFPGKSLTSPKLNPHQKNAVWRIVNEKATLLAHCVGAGKTWTMQAAGMELRRMGLARKIVYTVPKNTVYQFESEFLQLYPNAKILVLTSDNLPDVPKAEKRDKNGNLVPLTEKEKATAAVNNAKRNEMLQRIKTEDWDAIIMSHDTFKRIPMSDESYRKFYEEQLDLYRDQLESAKREGNKSSARDIEGSIKKLEEKLKKLVNEQEKFNVGTDTFETLGIDQLFVDEADIFKNLEFPTRLNNVHGISNSGSQRSTDLYTKIRYLTTNPSTHGVVFATGTPVSNTVAEAYTMCRYLAQDKLEALGLRNFDDFAKAFFKIEDGIEPKPDGSGFRIATLVDGLRNLPEFKRIWRAFADVKRIEDLPYIKDAIPKAKRVAVSFEQSAEVTRFMKEDVMKRVQALTGKAVKGGDNILKIMNDIRLKCLEDGRIPACAQKIVQEYRDSDAAKGAQLVFCDLSTPKDAEMSEGTKSEADKAEDARVEKLETSVYQRLKDQLVEMGIPAEEIKFVHEAKTDKAKQALFEDVRAGRVRVLIGSTTKMGAGTNMQNKLVALHHLQVPWRPRDLEQREGRILRQGNENKEVRIYTYGAPGSFDAVMWAKVLAKEKNIGPMMDSDMSARSIDYQSEVTPSHTEMIAMCSGDQSQVVLAQAQNRVDNLRLQKQAWERGVREASRKVLSLPSKIAGYKQGIENARKDMAERKGRSDDFRVTIGGTTYTKQKEANEAFTQAVARARSSFAKDSADGRPSLPYSVGNVAGFNVTLTASGDKIDAHLQGYNTYTAQTASGVGVWNEAWRGPETRKSGLEDMVKSSQMELEEAKKAEKAPFEQADELREAEETLAAVEEKIRKDASGQRAAEAAEETTTEEAPADEGTTKFSVTNRRLTADTPVKVVDVTDSPRFKLGLKEARESLKQALLGHSFHISGTNAVGKIVQRTDFDGVSLFDGIGHIEWSRPKTRWEATRLKSLGDVAKLKEIFANAVYVERDTKPARNPRHGKSYFVDLYVPVKNGDKIYTLRIVAEDTNLAPDEYEIRDVDLYDMYKIRETDIRKSENPENGYVAVSPDTVTVADLLRGVKGRDGELFVNEDGTLNMAPYTDEELEAKIKEVHPNAESWKRTETGVEFDTPNGMHWRYDFVDGIVLTQEQREQANKDYGGTLTGDEYVQGMAHIADREAVITLTRDSEAGTADHEALHVAMAGALTDHERKVLYNHAEGKTLSEKEEWIADDFKRWQERRRAGKGSLFGKLYQKIQDFADRMLGFMRENPNNIYRKIASGEVFERPLQNEASHRVVTKMSIRDSMDKFVDSYGKKLRERIQGESAEDAAARHPNIHLQKPKEKRSVNTMEVLLNTVGSPSQSKNPFVKMLYRWNVQMRDTQSRLTRAWNKMLSDSILNLKSDDDLKSLSDILWEGDEKQHEFTEEELKERGVSKAVISAYKGIRKLLKAIYTEVDRVRGSDHMETKNGVTEEELRRMSHVPWFRILSSRKNEDGTYNVTFNTPNYMRHAENLSRAELADLKKEYGDRIHVAGKVDGKTVYYVRTAKLTEREGYMPHLFHDYFITCRKLNKERSAEVRTEEGITKHALDVLKANKDVTIRKETKRNGHYDVEYTMKVYDTSVVGSGVSMKDAVDIASRMETKNGEEYFIAPKTLLSDENHGGVLVGDRDYAMIVNSIAKNAEIPLAEAKAQVDDTLRRTARHRFYGSLLHRKGAEGFERDTLWVLQQHVKNASRYCAVEPFKSNAINLFERTFGGFNDSYDYFSLAGWANYYIRSALGQPRTLEKAVNTLCNRIPMFKELFSDPNGGRGTRAFASDVTSVMSAMKLGFFNASSAVLNIFQLCNLPGHIGYKATLAGVKHALHPTEADKRVLEAANVAEDIGLDSVDGISKLHLGSGVGTHSFLNMRSDRENAAARMFDYGAQALGKTMALFSATEQFARRATILAGYWTARANGLDDAKALEKARELNTKTNFDYSQADDPRLFGEIRGTIIGDLGIQFKKFPVKQFGAMVDFLGPNTTMEQKAKFWGTWFIVGGLFRTVPAADLIMQVLGAALGDDDDDLESRIKQWMMETAGDNPMMRKLAITAMYGIWGNAGIDISNRVGMSDVFPTYEGPASLFGPTGNTIAGLYRAFQMADPVYGLRQTAPSLANLWTAYTGQSVDKNGNVSQDFDMFGRALKAAGFRTVDESLASDMKRISNRYKTQRTNDRRDARTAYKRDPTPENARALRELGYTGKQIAQLRREAAQESRERTRNGMSRQEQRDLRGVMDFVNAE